MTGKNGGKPFATLRSNYSISKVYDLNVSGIDPITESRRFTAVNTNPQYTCNLLCIVCSSDEASKLLDYIIRVKFIIRSEMAGRI